MTVAIRSHCGLGLVAAKAVTDRVLDGNVVRVQTKNAETAAKLVEELTQLGAIAAVEPAK